MRIFQRVIFVLLLLVLFAVLLFPSVSQYASNDPVGLKVEIRVIGGYHNSTPLFASNDNAMGKNFC
ncbi:MAG: hypothetical protein NT002_11605 [candidate division Zixibacteria bacterium]|nr:hypothetical protein [candidate division Zixibacteria bacterium]